MVIAEEAQEKIATLNKMAEVLINLKRGDHESRNLAKYDFTKMNMTESITLDRLNSDILKFQEELGNDINEYEEVARRLETFVKLLSDNRNINQNLQKNISLEYIKDK
ncbi:lantibiotic (srt) production protein [Streptococcus uberis]|nr:helical hairpin domain-containing protein [Streptococcus uberis]MCK1255512.1 lantibiotic (srt) production protein [Streptococcus uberis]